MPGDVIVGDAEGVVVIPAAMAEEVAHGALEQELREEWALERVQAGESIRGVYPLRAEREAEFEAWRAARHGPDAKLELVLLLPARGSSRPCAACARAPRPRSRSARRPVAIRSISAACSVIGRRAAVGDLHEDRAPDRVEAPRDVAQQVDDRRRSGSARGRPRGTPG